MLDKPVDEAMLRRIGRRVRKQGAADANDDHIRRRLAAAGLARSLAAQLAAETDLTS